MPDVDSTLRKIAQWKYIIISDLTKSFYQIPLSHDSMKYCGVVTPYRGIRVYVRTAMGMPGSEIALEELTCRVLGDLVQEGIVAKVADDLYCGGSTPEELLQNWKRVLHALRRCDLNLSASKTVIAPKEAVILGWVWCQGTIRASKHRISTLTTCQIPATVAGLRSFIGAFKVLSRVIPDCSHFLAPLDSIAAGRDSKEKITWTDELITSFKQAQQALTTNKAITLPRPEDQLWIVTDGALRRSGLGATLYINRENKILLAGCFSAKLRTKSELVKSKLSLSQRPLNISVLTLFSPPQTLVCYPTANRAYKHLRSCVEANFQPVPVCLPFCPPQVVTVLLFVMFPEAQYYLPTSQVVMRLNALVRHARFAPLSVSQKIR